MATLKSFEEFEVWKDARRLSFQIYSKSLEGSFSKDFGLKDQINRSSGSIMDNIAEGYERDGNREFVHFLSIAKGSAGELRSQLHRALDRKHISQQDFDLLLNEALTIVKRLSVLMTYLMNSNAKGLNSKTELINHLYL